MYLGQSYEMCVLPSVVCKPTSHTATRYFESNGNTQFMMMDHSTVYSSFP